MSRLISYNDLPAHNIQLKDNPYILKHYRRPTQSLAACIQSMTTIHCETANFWTHFIPALLALLFLMSNFSPYPLSFIRYEFDWSSFTIMDRFVLSIPMFGTLVCFGTSSVFHVFVCHNGWAGLLNELDLMGIMYMTTSLCVGFDYFKFYNSRFLQYSSIISAVTTGGISIMIVRSLRDPRNKGFRVLIYVIACLLLMVPAIASLYLEKGVAVDSIVKHFVRNCAFYGLLGGLFYASKVPEKLFPGYFDLLGSSHMCMHVCTAMGVFYLYEGTVRTAVLAYNETQL